MTWGRSTSATSGPGQEHLNRQASVSSGKDSPQLVTNHVGFPFKPRSRAHSFSLAFFAEQRGLRTGKPQARHTPSYVQPSRIRKANVFFGRTQSDRSPLSDGEPSTTNIARLNELDALSRRSSKDGWDKHAAMTKSMGDGDEFSCCGLSEPSSSEHVEYLTMSARHPASGPYPHNMHPSMMLPSLLRDPAYPLHNKDEETLDMADLLDRTLLPIMLSPLHSATNVSDHSTILTSPYSSASSELGPETPSSAVFPTTLKVSDRSARHARSMPSLNAVFRNQKRSTKVPFGSDSNSSTKDTRKGTLTVPDQRDLSEVDIGALDGMKENDQHEKETTLRIQSGPTAPVMKAGPAQQSPLRTRRRKPPLTIAAPPAQALFSSVDLDGTNRSHLLSPSPSSPLTPTTMLRARRSKSSLKTGLLSPPPCPPPMTPLPDIPQVSTLAKPTDGVPLGSGAKHVQQRVSQTQGQPPIGDQFGANGIASGASSPRISGEDRRGKQRVAASDVHQSIGSAASGRRTFERFTDRTLSSISTCSTQSKASHSQFSSLSYDSYQTSPGSVSWEPYQPSDVQLTPRSSTGHRDSRLSLASMGLPADASMIASIGNHSLSKTMKPAQLDRLSDVRQLRDHEGDEVGNCQSRQAMQHSLHRLSHNDEAGRSRKALSQSSIALEDDQEDAMQARPSSPEDPAAEHTAYMSTGKKISRRPLNAPPVAYVRTTTNLAKHDINGVEGSNEASKSGTSDLYVFGFAF